MMGSPYGITEIEGGYGKMPQMKENGSCRLPLEKQARRGPQQMLFEILYGFI